MYYRFLLLVGVGISACGCAQDTKMTSASPDIQNSRNPSFRVQNQSGKTINEIYASPSQNQQWGADRLGDATLSIGNSFVVNLNRQTDCTNDIRVVFEDATVFETKSVNTCRIVNLGVSGPNTNLIGNFAYRPSSQQSRATSQSVSDEQAVEAETADTIAGMRSGFSQFLGSYNRNQQTIDRYRHSVQPQPLGQATGMQSDQRWYQPQPPSPTGTNPVASSGVCEGRAEDVCGRVINGRSCNSFTLFTDYSRIPPSRTTAPACAVK